MKFNEMLHDNLEVYLQLTMSVESLYEYGVDVDPQQMLDIFPSTKQFDHIDLERHELFEEAIESELMAEYKDKLKEYLSQDEEFKTQLLKYNGDNEAMANLMYSFTHKHFSNEISNGLEEFHSKIIPSVMANPELNADISALVFSISQFYNKYNTYSGKEKFNRALKEILNTGLFEDSARSFVTRNFFDYLIDPWLAKQFTYLTRARRNIIGRMPLEEVRTINNQQRNLEIEEELSSSQIAANDNPEVVQIVDVTLNWNDIFWQTQSITSFIYNYVYPTFSGNCPNLNSAEEYQKLKNSIDNLVVALNFFGANIDESVVINITASLKDNLPLAANYAKEGNRELSRACMASALQPIEDFIISYINSGESYVQIVRNFYLDIFNPVESLPKGTDLVADNINKMFNLTGLDLIKLANNVNIGLAKLGEYDKLINLKEIFDLNNIEFDFDMADTRAIDDYVDTARETGEFAGISLDKLYMYKSFWDIFYEVQAIADNDKLIPEYDPNMSDFMMVVQANLESITGNVSNIDYLDLVYHEILKSNINIDKDNEIVVKLLQGINIAPMNYQQMSDSINAVQVYANNVNKLPEVQYDPRQYNLINKHKKDYLIPELLVKAEIPRLRYRKPEQSSMRISENL